MVASGAKRASIGARPSTKWRSARRGFGFGGHPRIPVLDWGWGTALAAHDGVIDGRAEQVRLRVELEVDGLDCDAGGRRHGSHRGGGEAALAEEVYRRRRRSGLGSRPSVRAERAMVPR